MLSNWNKSHENGVVPGELWALIIGRKEPFVERLRARAKGEGRKSLRPWATETGAKLGKCCKREWAAARVALELAMEVDTIGGSREEQYYRRCGVAVRMLNRQSVASFLVSGLSSGLGYPIFSGSFWLTCFIIFIYSSFIIFHSPCFIHLYNT